MERNKFRVAGVGTHHPDRLAKKSAHSLSPNTNQRSGTRQQIKPAAVGGPEQEDWNPPCKIGSNGVEKDPHTASVSVDVARSSSAASRVLLSKVCVGAKVSVFWPDEDRSCSGKVTERHPHQGRHVYAICCDSGDTKTIDLATQTCCIFGEMHADIFDAQDVDGSRAPLTFPKTAQGREPVPALHAAFPVSDDDAEIYWPKVGHMTEEQCG